MIALLAGLPAALVAFYSSHELAGLFLFLLVEEAGLPLLFPGDLLIVAAGARRANVPGDWLAILGTAALAAALGSSFLYLLARRGGRPLLTRYARYLHLNETRMNTAERWLRRRAAIAIVVGRLVPGLRTPTTVVCGLLDVPYRIFAPATACAALLWALAYFALGMFARAQSEELTAVAAGDVDVVSVALVALAVSVSLGALVAARRRTRQGVLGWSAAALRRATGEREASPFPDDREASRLP